MAEGINLPRMTWYPLSAERIRWEGHRLHLALARHVEAVRAETSRKMRLVRWTRVCQPSIRCSARWHVRRDPRPGNDRSTKLEKLIERRDFAWFWSSDWLSFLLLFFSFFFLVLSLSGFGKLVRGFELRALTRAERLGRDDFFRRNSA